METKEPVYYCESCRSVCIPVDFIDEVYGIPYLACPACLSKVEEYNNEEVN